MALRAALQSKLKPRSVRRLYGLCACLALVRLAGCGDPEDEVIARFTDDASVTAGVGGAGGVDAVAGTGGTGGTGVTGGTGGTGGEAGVAGIQSTAGAPNTRTVSPKRGRVKVVNGNLVTDIGTPLRGVFLPVDTDGASDYASLIAKIAQTTGLNTLHVYLEDYGQAVGSNQSIADKLVALAQQYGLYVMIGIGTGGYSAADNTKGPGTFNPGEVSDFWTRYAALYANESNVLFEVQNNPEVTKCNTLVLDKTINMELSAYKNIRMLAPDSHISLFSSESLLPANTLTDAVTRLGAGVDWSNASFAMEQINLSGYPECVQLANLSVLTDAARKLNVPLLVTELPHTSWQAYLKAFDQAQIGWMLYQWFADSKDLPSYFSAMTTGTATWCPDQGTYPQDSGTCL